MAGIHQSREGPASVYYYQEGSGEGKKGRVMYKEMPLGLKIIAMVDLLIALD